MQTALVDDLNTRTREECSGIPETLLDIMDGKCSTSAWGQIVWEEVQRSAYSEKVLAPLSSRIIISKTVIKQAESIFRWTELHASIRKWINFHAT